MSLTEAQSVFGSVHETALNDLLKAFFSARPRFLNYGSSSLFPPGTPLIPIPPIPFPGIPAGIAIGIHFAIPTIDIHPDNSGGRSPLTPNPGQFIIHTTVTLLIGCFRYYAGPKDRGAIAPLSTQLDVFASGSLYSTNIGTGAGVIGFLIDKIELVDVKPDSLESLLECMIRMMLQGVLSNIQIPIESMMLGAIPFPMVLARGPLAETDMLKVFANV